MNKILLFSLGALVLVSAAPSSREKRSPQMPPMPPGMPPMPEMPQMAEGLLRIARHAQETTPPSSRVARHAQDPTPPAARVARQAFNVEAEKPQHIRKEAFYSSLTSMARKKRGSNNRETAIRG